MRHWHRTLFGMSRRLATLRKARALFCYGTHKSTQGHEIVQLMHKATRTQSIPISHTGQVCCSSRQESKTRCREVRRELPFGGSGGSGGGGDSGEGRRETGVGRFFSGLCARARKVFSRVRPIGDRPFPSKQLRALGNSPYTLDPRGLRGRRESLTWPD